MAEANTAVHGENQVERRLIRPREIAAYALTSYGLNNLTTYVGSTKQYFMMSFLGLSGTAYGTLSTIATVWDALDDPISGIIIDLLLYNITPNTNERSTLIATQKFLNLFTYLPSLVPIFVDFLPNATHNTVTQPEVYKIFAIIFVLIAVAAAIFGFFNMRERVSIATKEEMQQVSFFKSAKSIITCRPLAALLLSNFFAGIKGVGGASEDFFWLNCTGRLSNRLLCSLFTGLPNYIITPLAPTLVRKFGLRTTAVSAGMFGGVAYTLLYFMGWKPTGNYWLDFALIVIGLTICGLPNHIMNVCDPLLKGDMFDYLEWENGIRNEGIVNAVSGYVNKLSSSIHAMLSGAVFDWIKFKPQHDAYGNIVPHTNPKVLKGIWGIFCLAPAAARFGYGFSLLLFNVHGERKERMLLELEERRKARVHDMKGELTADEDND